MVHRTAGSYLSSYWVLNNLQSLVFWDSSQPKKGEDIQLPLVLHFETGDKHRTKIFTPGRRKGRKGSLILRNSDCVLGEANNRGWGGWHHQLNGHWVNSRSWWWTGRPGMLQSMGSQRVGHWATELNILMCAQLCLTLCDPVDCNSPGSSVHGIFQARILQWVAMSSSRESSWPRDRTRVFCIGRQILYHWATFEAPTT